MTCGFYHDDMTRVTLALIALLLTIPTAAADAPPVKGSLCFGNDCTSVSGTQLDVAPATTPRHFTWRADDGSRIVLGILDANAKSVDLAAKEWREVALRIAGEPRRAWPVDVRLLVQHARDEWPLVLDAKMVNKLTTLALPPGRYTLRLEAEHYHDAGRPIDVAKTARLDLHEIRLRPLPLVTGRVVITGKDGDQPLSGATIADDLANPLGTSDGTGAFRVELTPRGTGAIVVAHPGYAPKTVKLDFTEGDKDAGVVRLTSGQPLTVHVIRPNDLALRKLTVSLYRVDTSWQPTKLASRELAPNEDEVRFDEVSPAMHVLVVNGDGPLEWLSQEVKVEEGKAATAEVTIAPFTLRGEVHFGDEPLAAGGIELSATPQVWRVVQDLDANGHFGGVMWQHGVVGGWVNGPQLGTGVFRDSPELGADPSTWSIQIPKRLVHGRIYDAETKQPVPHISADMRAVRAMGMLPVDDDGSYRIVAIEPGTYEVFVNAEGYMKATATVTIAENDGSKELDVPLTRGAAQALELRWPDGTPVSAAHLCDTPIGNGICRFDYFSSRSGVATIRGVKGETRTLYVLPREGSLGVVRVAIGGDDAKPVAATIAPPAGTLRITFKGPPATVAVRWNGEPIPSDILISRFLNAWNGHELVWDHVPAGAYELSAAGHAPVRVGVATGEQAVELPTESRE
jgi:Carboxypeptidase regulatory-like domain